MIIHCCVCVRVLYLVYMVGLLSHTFFVSPELTFLVLLGLAAGKGDALEGPVGS